MGGGINFAHVKASAIGANLINVAAAASDATISNPIIPHHTMMKSTPRFLVAIVLALASLGVSAVTYPDWVDYMSNPVTGIKAVKQANGDILVTWNAQTKCYSSATKAQVDIPAGEAPTYRVQIGTPTAFDTTLADNLSATTYTIPKATVDALTPPRMFQVKVSSCYKGVWDRAASDMELGMTADVCSTKLYGGHYSAPCKVLFWDDVSTEAYTLLINPLVYIDANSDNNRWVTGNKGPKNPVTGLNFNKPYLAKVTAGRDDYILALPLAVEAGKTYEYTCYLSSDGGPAGFEVVGGYGTNKDMLTDQIIPLSSCPNGAQKLNEFKGRINATQDGKYYIAMHGVGTKTQPILYFSGYEVGDANTSATPSKVEDLKYVSDPYGASRIAISFKAPTLLADGNLGTGLTDIVLYRDGEAVNTWPAPTAGEALSYVDTPTAGEWHDYSIIASNTDGAGTPAAFRLFGVTNLAATPSAVTAVGASSTEVTVSWDTVTDDVNGNPLTGVKYNIYQQTPRDITTEYPYNSMEGRLIAADVTGNTVTIPVVKEGGQTLARYIVRSVTAAGEGDPVRTADWTSVGTPRTMPWSESFRGGMWDEGVGIIAPFGLWYDHRTEDANWQHDGDHGALMLQHKWLEEGGMILPTIHVEGTDPVFSIQHLNASSGNKSPIKVQVNDGTGWKTLFNKTSGELGSTMTWLPIEVSLADYIGKDVDIRILLTFYTTVSYWDNIRVYDKKADELAVLKVFADYDVLDAGRKCPVYVRVKNLGESDLDATGAGTVTLSRGSTTVGTLPVGAIKAGRPALLTFSDIIPEGVDNLTYEAVLSTGESRTFDIAVHAADGDRPMPQYLEGEAGTEAITLNWQAPALDGCGASTFTEGFEDWEPWSLGEAQCWTMIDGDGQPNTVFKYAPMPAVDQKAFPWFNWNVDSMPDPGKNHSYLAPYGQQCLVSRYTYGPRGSITDDWAILPRLDGKAQEIRLITDPYWSIQVYTSMTGNEPEDFVKLADMPNGQYCSLREMRFEVPEGTRYFAVHSGAWPKNSAIFARLDNVRFRAALVTDDLLGYNVYCDGVKLNGEPLVDTTSQQPIQYGNHKYHVTALYPWGESEPSNVYELSLTGLDGNTLSSVPEEVARYAADGREVSRDYRGVVIVKYSDGSVRKMTNVK